MVMTHTKTQVQSQSVQNRLERNGWTDCFTFLASVVSNKTDVKTATGAAVTPAAPVADGGLGGGNSTIASLAVINIVGVSEVGNGK